MSLCFSVFSRTWSSPSVTVLSSYARRFLPRPGLLARALTTCCACTLVLAGWIMRVFCVLAKLYLWAIHPCTLVQAECPLGTTTESKSSWGFLTSWQSEIALLLMSLLTQRWARENRMQFTVIVTAAWWSCGSTVRWSDRFCNSSSVLIGVIQLCAALLKRYGFVFQSLWGQSVWTLS